MMLCSEVDLKAQLCVKQAGRHVAHSIQEQGVRPSSTSGRGVFSAV